MEHITCSIYIIPRIQWQINLYHLLKHQTLNPILHASNQHPLTLSTVTQGELHKAEVFQSCTNSYQHTKNYQTTWTCYKDAGVQHVLSHNTFSSPGHMPVFFKQQQVTVVTRKSLDLGVKDSWTTERPQHPSSLGCQKPEIGQIKGKICEIIFWSRCIRCIPF